MSPCREHDLHRLDFAEITVADYIEYKLGYCCPRQLRYDFKWNRNESTKGCDVVGFKFAQDGAVGPQDELFIFEAKAQLSLGAQPQNRLQVAIDDSNKDKLREAMTLNALRQRFLERGDRSPADQVARFQNETDRPFKCVSGAAAPHDVTTFDPAHPAAVTTAAHFNASNLKLIVVTGTAMMQLVHALYQKFEKPACTRSTHRRRCRRLAFAEGAAQSQIFTGNAAGDGGEEFKAGGQRRRPVWISRWSRHLRPGIAGRSDAAAGAPDWNTRKEKPGAMAGQDCVGKVYFLIGNGPEARRVSGPCRSKK